MVGCRAKELPGSGASPLGAPFSPLEALSRALVRGDWDLEFYVHAGTEISPRVEKFTDIFNEITRRNVEKGKSHDVVQFNAKSGELKAHDIKTNLHDVWL